MQVRRGAFTAVVVAGSLALAACTGGGDSPPPTTSSTTSASSRSTTSSTRTQSPSPTKTVALPLDATKHTDIGATAYARFFILRYGEAAHAGNPELMAGLAAADCEGCEALKNVVADMQSKGQRTDIAAMRVRESSVQDKDEKSVTVGVLAEESPKQILDSTGRVVTKVKGARFDFRVKTAWLAQGWQVTDLRVVKG